MGSLLEFQKAVWDSELAKLRGDSPSDMTDARIRALQGGQANFAIERFGDAIEVAGRVAVPAANHGHSRTPTE
jgi:hypothetical protein